MTATTARRPRAADAAKPKPAKKRTVTKPAGGDAICDALDEADLLEEAEYLGNHQPDAVKVILSLDEQQRARTHEMIAIQRVYLQLLEDLKDPVDQSGRCHDLRAMPATVMAVCWTMALRGYRRVGEPYIKQRALKDRQGTYGGDAVTWVDSRLPDDPEDQLDDNARSDDRSLPCDVRSLAAKRDGDDGLPQHEWHVDVTPRIEYAPRPKDW